MRKLILLLILSLFLVSCGASKKRGYTTAQNSKPALQKVKNQSKRMQNSFGNEVRLKSPKDQKINISDPRKTKAERVVNYALGYLGTKYLYGGTTKKGTDCSGLVYRAYLDGADIFLPRTSQAMALEGHKILKEEAQPGDLLFFKTNPRRNVISHVGLVVKHEDNDIEFISATTHGGVMVSSLNERYWRNAFVEIRRLL